MPSPQMPTPNALLESSDSNPNSELISPHDIPFCHEVVLGDDDDDNSSIDSFEAYNPNPLPKTPSVTPPPRAAIDFGDDDDDDDDNDDDGSVLSTFSPRKIRRANSESSFFDTLHSPSPSDFLSGPLLPILRNRVTPILYSPENSITDGQRIELSPSPEACSPPVKKAKISVTTYQGPTQFSSTNSLSGPHVSVTTVWKIREDCLVSNGPASDKDYEPVKITIDLKKDQSKREMIDTARSGRGERFIVPKTDAKNELDLISSFFEEKQVEEDEDEQAEEDEEEDEVEEEDEQDDEEEEDEEEEEQDDEEEDEEEDEQDDEEDEEEKEGEQDGDERDDNDNDDYDDEDDDDDDDDDDDEENLPNVIQYGADFRPIPPPEVETFVPNMNFPSPEAMKYLNRFVTYQDAVPEKINDRIVFMVNNGIRL
ncbi:unnamed protein product [Caenorhabditis brenneri]